MWIKKSEEKMTAEVAAMRLKRGLLVILFVGWVFCFRLALLKLQASWMLKIILTMAGAVCLAALFNIRKATRRSEVYICDRCNRVKAAGGALDCFCSGRFHSMEKMEWMDPSIEVKDRRSGQCDGRRIPSSG
jgi:hypothetical protein